MTKHVIIKPGNQELKQLIKHFGNEWIELRRKNIQCLNGISVLCESPDKNHIRWVPVRFVEDIKDIST